MRLRLVPAPCRRKATSSHRCISSPCTRCACAALPADSGITGMGARPSPFTFFIRLLSLNENRAPWQNTRAHQNVITVCVGASAGAHASPAVAGCFATAAAVSGRADQVLVARSSCPAKPAGTRYCLEPLSQPVRASQGCPPMPWRALRFSSKNATTARFSLFLTQYSRI